MRLRERDAFSHYLSSLPLHTNLEARARRCTLGEEYLFAGRGLAVIPISTSILEAVLIIGVKRRINAAMTLDVQSLVRYGPVVSRPATHHHQRQEHSIQDLKINSRWVRTPETQSTTSALAK